MFHFPFSDLIFDGKYDKLRKLRDWEVGIEVVERAEQELAQGQVVAFRLDLAAETTPGHHAVVEVEPEAPQLCEGTGGARGAGGGSGTRYRARQGHRSAEGKHTTCIEYYLGSQPRGPLPT